MKERRRFQFTVRRMLLHSTAIALIFACVRPSGAALIYQVVIGLYYAALVTIFVLLLPNVRGRLAAVRKRREMVLEVAKRKPRRLKSPPNPAELDPSSESQ